MQLWDDRRAAPDENVFWCTV